MASGALRRALALLLLSGADGWAQAQQNIVPAGATWHYLRGTSEASNPTTAWRARGFDARAWATGPAPFYYGDGLAAGTLLGDMQGGYTSVFLRHEFTVTKPGELTRLTLLADYDDGFVAWINGVEVARSGVAGEPRFNSTASASHEGGSFVSFPSTIAPASYLVDGPNVLAVQAFNRNLSSSTDFRIDVALEAERHDATPPRVAAFEPAGPEVATLTEITVSFTKPVVGVVAGDLLLNDEPAASLTAMTGGDRYRFRFPQPPPGHVAVGWSEANRIQDLQGNPFNTEEAGSRWSYVLSDTEASEVRELTSVAGALVSRLDQIEVVFSEPVLGLEAADLLVNGQPALALEGTDAGPYVIRFAPPAPGVVQFAWAPAHGVTDTAPARNRFAGGGWTVTFDPNLTPGNVVVNEFLTANETGLRDEDGEARDWIELHNRGAAPVELLGWSLTDDRGAPGKWTFPARRLAPGEYLVVFASGKDRRTVTGANRLHTNFELAAFGEHLALHNAESPRRVVAEFNPSYPEQRRDISYGRGGTAEDDWRYFTRPTPGAPNGGSSVVGMVPEPQFSVGRGTFDAPFDLVLTTPLAGARLRYTLDGSEPSATNGLLYTIPLRVTKTTIVRAVAFREGHLPSRPQTHSYLFLGEAMTQPDRPPGFPSTWGTWSGFPNNQVPADYGMDLDPLRTDPDNPASMLDPAKVARLEAGLRELPVVSLALRPDDIFGPNGLYPRASDSNKAANEKPCSVEMIEPDGTTAFVIDGGLDLHGNASRSPLKNPKHGFKLTFKSEYGPTTLRHRLFPDSPAAEFDDLILRPDFNSSWRHWSDSRGNGNGAFQRSRGTRTRFAWSQETFRAMGQVAPHTLYFHLFINGLYWGTYDFAEQPTEQFAANYYGGEPGEHDIYDQGARRQGTSAAYNAMLGLAGLNTLAGYERMRQYLDLPEFMDYMLLHFYVGHQDWGDNKNWYAIRPRVDGPTGTFKYLPWDQECILLEENVNRVPNAGGSADVPSGLHTRLQDNPQYRLDFADRVFKHLIVPGGALTAEANIARWRKWQALLDNAIVAESCRWGDYRRDVHRYSDGTYELYTRDRHWLAENQRLVNSYFVNRGNIVLGQLRTAGLYPNLEAPLFNQPGGRVATGFALRVAAAAGTIYYTTDGTDPRVYGSGAVASTALTYGEPITLDRTVSVRARAWQNGTWSALNEVTFFVDELGLPLRFTEIMYHPPGGEAYEFLELENVGPVPLDVGRFSLRGVEFIFPDGTVIPPGARVVLGSDANPAAFQSRYPGVVVLGTFRGNLDNAGERLALVAREGRTVTTVHFDDEGGWPAAADGGGHSLEVVDPRGHPSAPGNWRTSLLTLGSPGERPSPPEAPVVRLNEVMADNRAAVPQGEAFPDWIELHNPGPAPVNLTNWSLTDNSDPRRYLFPPGTTIPAGGYLVVWCDANTSAPGRHTGFALSRTGETVRLFDAATNHADALTFGRQVPDLSVGRVGAAWELTQPTPGAANRAAPLASPTDLAFNEWLAAPEPGGEDWIELFNRSQTAPVRLEGLYLGTHAALDRLGVPAFLPPGGYLQLLADEAAGVDHLQFKLPASGGDLVLYDETGREIERVGYAEQSRGISAGRFPDGTATIQSFAGSVSPGAPNYRLDDQPLPNVVISEIMYDPAPDPAGLAEVAHREFLELHNLSTNSVPLFDPSHPNNTWRLAGGITFQVPTGTTMPPGGWLVVVAFDPLEDPAALAGFRAAYGAQAVVTGPWSGRLANEGETIELLRPDTPLSGDPPDAELVPYVLVERVTYSNQAPWPTAASGTGASLQRIPPDRSGNDPGHWVAAPASPGWSGNSSESDTDGDGLPDGWERQHGTDPAVADAGEDPDDDGLSNLEEFLAGTDPQSAASVLVLRVVEVSATGVMLDFAATAGRHYTALRCADLESGEWVPFAQVPAAGTGGLVTVTDTLSPGSGARFYQILSTR